MCPLSAARGWADLLSQAAQRAAAREPRDPCQPCLHRPGATTCQPAGPPAARAGEGAAPEQSWPGHGCSCHHPLHRKGGRKPWAPRRPSSAPPPDAPARAAEQGLCLAGGTSPPAAYPRCQSHSPGLRFSLEVAAGVLRSVLSLLERGRQRLPWPPGRASREAAPSDPPPPPPGSSAQRGPCLGGGGGALGEGIKALPVAQPGSFQGFLQETHPRQTARAAPKPSRPPWCTGPPKRNSSSLAAGAGWTWASWVPSPLPGEARWAGRAAPPSPPPPSPRRTNPPRLSPHPAACWWCTPGPRGSLPTSGTSPAPAPSAATPG